MDDAPNITNIRFEIKESKDRLRTEVSVRVDSVKSNENGEVNNNLKQHIDNNNNNINGNGQQFNEHVEGNNHGTTTTTEMNVELVPMPQVNQVNMIPINSYQTPGFENNDAVSSSSDNDNNVNDVVSPQGTGSKLTASTERINVKSQPGSVAGDGDIIAAVNGTHNGV